MNEATNPHEESADEIGPIQTVTAPVGYQIIIAPDEFLMPDEAI
jgi:hypothetical protein